MCVSLEWKVDVFLSLLYTVCVCVCVCVFSLKEFWFVAKLAIIYTRRMLKK
jgi:hypothetical protein